MQKIHLNASATVIPVTNAIRAKKGDYLLVKDEGDIHVIDNKIFQALTRTELVTNPKSSSVQNSNVLKTETFLNREELSEVILGCLKQDDFTTTALMETMLGTQKPYNSYKYNKIWSALAALKKQGIIQSIKIDVDEKGNKISRPVSLWGLPKSSKEYRTSIPSSVQIPKPTFGRIFSQN